jgi:uracil-DNA glycosylase family 4
MSRLLPEVEEIVAARLRYYRDLGVYDFYRRGEAELLTAEPESLAEAAPLELAPVEPAPVELSKLDPSAPAANTSLDPEPAIPPRKPIVLPPALVPDILPAAQRPAALEAIRAEIGDCTRCPLAFQGRHKIVFADGDANARLMFVGEGPGADEDAQGLPFVGRAGQLLNNMINAMGVKREQVYIANVVKCRPPQNRTPEPDEANTCMQFLWQQIDVVRPEVLVALGSTAATYLLGRKASLSSLRGQLHDLRGSKLIVTYHPAYLLRDPTQKKEAWKDLQIAMRELGLKASSPS